MACALDPDLDRFTGRIATMAVAALTVQGDSGSVYATKHRRQLMKRVLLVVAGLASLWAVPAVAHHSFAAEFDVAKPITLRGTLTMMEWLNPHGWVHVDVTQPDGTVVSWAIEVAGPNALLRRGLRQADFPVGSELSIEGYRAKNGSPTANGTSVKFADGRNFFLGASDAPY